MKPTLRIDLTNIGDLPLIDLPTATSMGISSHDLAIMVRRGLLWKVAHGWYSSRMDATDEERHILRAVAVLGLHGETAVACRHSAVLLHGLPLARTDLTNVEIGKVHTGHGRIRDGVRVSRSPSSATTCKEVFVPIANTSVRVIDPATAIVGTAMNNNPVGALVAADHAVRHEVCTRADIAKALADARGYKGIAPARDALADIDPRHESPGETLTAVLLRRQRWDFDPQVEVLARGRRYRVDFALRDHRVAIEFDGAIKYTGPEVMAAQLAREADLRAEGWAIVRITWDELDDEAAIIRKISAAITEAAASAA